MNPAIPVTRNTNAVPKSASQDRRWPLVAQAFRPANGRWAPLKGCATEDSATRFGRVALLTVAFLAIVLAPEASAHGVSGKDALFLQSIRGAAIGPLMYLGAKHMVTGYDHLAFLVGVIFFLYRLKDVVEYVSLFTIGHSVTLLVGVLGGVRANAHVIDAIIGLSVVYKAFENLPSSRSSLFRRMA